MKYPALAVLFLSLLIVATSCQQPEVDVNTKNTEKPIIEEVVKNSIGWALTKDTALLYSCFAHSDDLFWFAPEAGSVTHGFDNFKQTVEGVFMNDAFKAVRFEVRDMKINLSRSGEVAWYSCMLDDENEWNGQPVSWLNVRWTGVLEKQDDKWRIVQMHFSNGIGPDGKADYGTNDENG